MKLRKEKTRTYNGKGYYKYRINIPQDDVENAGFKDGDELKVESKKGEIKLKK